MSSSPLNPSQHVERIREILIGRDLHQMQGRLLRLERSLQHDATPDPASVLDIQHSLHSLRLDQAALRQEIQALKTGPHRTHSSSAPQASTESLSAEMEARVDARCREIMSHLQQELSALKGQIEQKLQTVQQDKVDRTELRSRFSRLASAALEESDTPVPDDGFLL